MRRQRQVDEMPRPPSVDPSFPPAPSAPWRHDDTLLDGLAAGMMEIVWEE
jgi:hypothetical protein